MLRMFDPNTRSTMTRRSSSLASLCLVAATMGACDGPEATPVVVDPGAEEEDDEPSTPEVKPPGPEGDGEEVDEDACKPLPVGRPRVMFVLDKSSSMTNSGQEAGAPAVDGEPTRWAKLHAVVGAIADELAGDVAMGAVLFPSTYAETAGGSVCDVRTVPEAAVGPYRAADLMSLLPPARSKGFLGGSPAEAAYTTALDHLEGMGGSAPTAIVLVSDGGHNCADDASPLVPADGGLAELVAFARDSLQIQTFVIGIDVAHGDPTMTHGDPDAILREIALAGGAAHGELGYFTTADAGALNDALGSFVGRASGASTTTTCR